MRRPWRAGLAAGLALALVSLVGACGGTTSGTGPAQLNWYIFNPSASIFEDAAKACSGQSHGAYDIKVNYLPAAADGQRVQLVRRLAAEDTAMDMLGLDVTWTPEFAGGEVDREWTGADARAGRAGTLPGRSTRPTAGASSTPRRRTPTPSCSGTARTWCPSHRRPGTR